jgi:hypothetical protein
MGELIQWADQIRRTGRVLRMLIEAHSQIANTSGQLHKLLLLEHNHRGGDQGEELHRIFPKINAPTQ